MSPSLILSQNIAFFFLHNVQYYVKKHVLGQVKNKKKKLFSSQLVLKWKNLNMSLWYSGVIQAGEYLAAGQIWAALLDIYAILVYGKAWYGSLLFVLVPRNKPKMQA